jgi:hypothetical protein
MVEVNLWTVARLQPSSTSSPSPWWGWWRRPSPGGGGATPALILGAVLLFVAFEAFFLGLLAVVAEFLLGPLAWWTIAVGNLLAVIAIGFYLWKQHPAAPGRLRRRSLRPDRVTEVPPGSLPRDPSEDDSTPPWGNTPGSG